MFVTYHNHVRERRKGDENVVAVTDMRETARLSCDAVVVGGGAAGVAAATTAARQGLSVILVERYGFCGGGAVAGLSGTVCGMYLALEDHAAKPEQVVFGFADEFVRALDGIGGISEPVRYGKTFTRVHDPHLWRDAADGFLRNAGVHILFHSVVSDTLLDGDRVAGVRLYNKSGKIDIEAQVTIDASGDADIIAMAGFPSFVGDNGRVQNPTMIFRMGGIDTGRFLRTYGLDTVMPPEVSELILQSRGNRYNLPRAKIWLFTTTRPSELLCNCTRILGPDGRELNTLIAADFTDAELEGRKQVHDYANFFRDHLAGCEKGYVIDTGVQVGVRQSRQGKGTALLKNADILAGTKFSDGIARSPWPIELHAGAKPKLEWLFNDFYEVPYGCFVPERGQSLLFAGRCLSAEHEAVASARVTAQCFSYGHAIGHAAALAVRNKVQPRDIAGTEVRDAVSRDGAKLNG